MSGWRGGDESKLSRGDIITNNLKITHFYDRVEGLREGG